MSHKMKNLIAGTLLACALSASAQEMFRYEVGEYGPVIAVKNLGAGGRTVRADITFKMGQQTGMVGGHIATGIGDLNRFFESGLPPIGEGAAVGAWIGCPDGGAAPGIGTESYYSGTVLDRDSCFTLPDMTAEYVLSYWVSIDYRVRVRLTQGTRVLFEHERSWAGVHPWHSRGFFILAVPGAAPNGPYTLSKVVVWSEDTPKAKPKPP